MLKKIKNKIRSLIAQKNVVYDESFFQDEWFINWDCLKFRLKDIIATLHKKNILDFGCGPGVMIDYMNSKGYNYIGCDYSKEAFELYRKNYGKNITKYQEKLSNINLKDIELIVSFDVFEHMTDEQIESFFIETKEVDTYLLNISRQKGIPGHINLKDDSQWKSFFEKNGLQIDLDKTNLARETYLDISYNPQDGWDKNIFVVVRSQ